MEFILFFEQRAESKSLNSFREVVITFIFFEQLPFQNRLRRCLEKAGKKECHHFDMTGQGFAICH